MKKLLVATIGWLTVSVTLFSQESLKGVVVHENERGRISPVAFANVYWMNTNIGTTTDSNGVFNLALSEETRLLVVSFVGYTSDTLMVNETFKPLTISLTKSVQLDAVDITYRRKSTEMSFINPLKMEEISEKELFKAACCNLSESFETNPSVDVNFTDAVTGTRQIRMLGLNGPYTMISRENMPGIRGLGIMHGLGFIPGTWISSIQVTKGVGTVVNGYESIAGQINFELKKPDEGEQTVANLFANQAGRTEVNFVNTQQVSKNWGTTLLLHGNVRPLEKDQNKDGFMDFPQQEQINLMNRWKYNGNQGLMGQIAIHYVKDDKLGGQTSNRVEEELKNDQAFSPYVIDIATEKIELFGKIGYVFPKFKYRSMGLLWSVGRHDQASSYGLRSYDAVQQNGYLNYIYQSILGTSDHQFKAGASFVYDHYEERLDSLNFNRLERVPGVFGEYTYTPNNNVTIVAGARLDEHNIFGTIFTPRLHLRWASDEQTVWRLLGGSGQRTSNVIADNQSLLATSRSFELVGSRDLPYGLEAERAWNFGFNVTRAFTLDYRSGYLSLDLYRTEFENKVVVDLDESASRVLFYNLNGASFSNSAQLELNYELLKFLDLRTAYRFTEVGTDFISGLRQQALTPKHRFFVNLAYETPKSVTEANWTFDLTHQWIGEQRIPTTQDNPIAYQRRNNSPAFNLLNAQVTRNVNTKWAVYVGMENILDYRQVNPIIASDNPFGNNFDASLVWGPIFGRMVYGGVRFVLKKKE